MSNDNIILASIGWCISTLGAVSIALQVMGYYPDKVAIYSWVANVFMLLFGVWAFLREFHIAKRHTQRTADKYMKLYRENRELRSLLRKAETTGSDHE